ncbi:MAG: PHP domain-containing protein [Clostridiales bacterium]|nr:PHP domain-containing protein [Clostridiales bacterium]
MYNIKVDTHTHTIASGHAFSTVTENAQKAFEAGLEAIAITDHFGADFLVPSLSGKPLFPAALNMKVLPNVMEGVRVLAGTEIDIVDKQGRLFFWNEVMFIGSYKGKTMMEAMLESRDLTIASVHNFEGSQQLSEGEGTRMYVNVLHTPGVHILGHIGRSRVPFHIPTVVKEAKALGKMIEINNSSLSYGEEIKQICRQIVEQCAKEGCPVVVSSDAHSAYEIGIFSQTISLLEEIHFPEELIANTSLEKLLATIAKANQNQGFVTLPSTRG